uniref:Transposase n=1 Tax=Peronospora matthiolae TaxID=2874970 RepID=A0AAV1U9E0_9STRA
MAQEACGHAWLEKCKISKLGSYLRAEADEVFHGFRYKWWSTEKTLAYAMEDMESAFSRTFTSAQVDEFFGRRKPATESWHSQYLYLMAVRNATGASASPVP